jgi:hypothetical protein
VIGFLRFEKQGEAMFDSSKIQPYISFTDLREWMAEAEALDELKTVLGASWQQEIGLATDVVVPPDDGPTVLFDEVPGCPKGFSPADQLFRRQAACHDARLPAGALETRAESSVFRSLSKDTPSTLRRLSSRAGRFSRTR